MFSTPTRSRERIASVRASSGGPHPVRPGGASLRDTSPEPAAASGPALDPLPPAPTLPGSSTDRTLPRMDGSPSIFSMDASKTPDAIASDIRLDVSRATRRASCWSRRCFSTYSPSARAANVAGRTPRPWAMAENSAESEGASFTRSSSVRRATDFFHGLAPYVTL